jgi:hypothetical protein
MAERSLLSPERAAKAAALVALADATLSEACVKDYRRHYTKQQQPQVRPLPGACPLGDWDAVHLNPLTAEQQHNGSPGSPAAAASPKTLLASIQAARQRAQAQTAACMQLLSSLRDARQQPAYTGERVTSAMPAAARLIKAMSGLSKQADVSADVGTDDGHDVKKHRDQPRHRSNPQ